MRAAEPVHACACVSARGSHLATSPCLEAKPIHFLKDAQVHQQPVQDVRDVAEVVRAAVSVPVQGRDPGRQPAGLLGPVQDHDEVCETKVATGLDILWDDGQPDDPAYTLSPEGFERSAQWGYSAGQLTPDRKARGANPSGITQMTLACTAKENTWFTVSLA
jgi:hypothetical protein